MNKKLPPEAYAFYISLGPADRSYEAVATKFDVCERTVADAAKREGWQERIVDQERRARDRVDEKAVETLAQMSERHLKVLKFMQGKAIETMKERPLDSCMDAMKAFVLAIDKERLIRGEPTDRTENLLETYRHEFERWMTPVEPKADPTAQDGGEPQPAEQASADEPADAEEPSAEDEAPPEDEPRAEEPGAEA
jgi:hypothetical protein